MPYVDVPITKLIPQPNNMRDCTPEEMESLKTSMREDGQLEPVIVSSIDENVILDGHQRYKAAKELGWKTLMCDFYDLKKEDWDEFSVLVNGATGGWHHEKLLQIPEHELLSGGFTEMELLRMEPNEVEYDASPDPNETGVVKTLTVVLNDNEFKKIVELLFEAKEKLEASDLTDTLLKLIDHYERNSG